MQQQQQQQKRGGHSRAGKKGMDSSVTVTGTTTTANSSSSSRASPMPGQPVVYTHTAAVFCLHQPFTPRNILEKEDKVWFRDFGFGRVHRMLGTCCSAFRYLKLAREMKKKKIQNIVQEEQQQQQQKFQQDYGFFVNDDETDCCCVIDSGFSLTHIVPTINGRAIVSNLLLLFVLKTCVFVCGL